MIPFLDQVELGEVELTTADRISGPSVKVPFVWKIVVDETGKDADYKRVAVAIAFEVILNAQRRTRDIARAD